MAFFSYHGGAPAGGPQEEEEEEGRDVLLLDEDDVELLLEQQPEALLEMLGPLAVRRDACVRPMHACTHARLRGTYSPWPPRGAWQRL